MAKVFNEQATVRIWRNIKVKGFIPTGHFGHAAVTITGITVPHGKAHISYWPAEGVSMITAPFKVGGSSTPSALWDKKLEMADLTAQRLEVAYRKEHGIPYPKEWDLQLAEAGKMPIRPRPGQKPDKHVSDEDRWTSTAQFSYNLWCQSPEVKIALPGILTKDRLWGLNLTRMWKWWDSFMKSDPYYKALGKQNCAGVALMALRAGGSEAFVEAPSVKVYTEPLQIEKYARLLEMQMERMETWARELDMEIKKYVTSGVLKGGIAKEDLSFGLWKPDKWKHASQLGTFQVRSTTIREIDDALAEYHTLNWGSQFNERYRALAKIFMGVVRHRQEKPDSGRFGAVLRLGAQVLAVLRNPAHYMTTNPA